MALPCKGDRSRALTAPSWRNWVNYSHATLLLHCYTAALLLHCYTPATLLHSWYTATLLLHSSTQLHCYTSATLLPSWFTATLLAATPLHCYLPAALRLTATILLHPCNTATLLHCCNTPATLLHYYTATILLLHCYTDVTAFAINTIIAILTGREPGSLLSYIIWKCNISLFICILLTRSRVNNESRPFLWVIYTITLIQLAINLLVKYVEIMQVMQPFITLGPWDRVTNWCGGASQRTSGTTSGGSSNRDSNELRKNYKQQ